MLFYVVRCSSKQRVAKSEEAEMSGLVPGGPGRTPHLIARKQSPAPRFLSAAVKSRWRDVICSLENAACLAAPRTPEPTSRGGGRLGPPHISILGHAGGMSLCPPVQRAVHGSRRSLLLNKEVSCRGQGRAIDTHIWTSRDWHDRDLQAREISLSLASGVLGTRMRATGS